MREFCSALRINSSRSGSSIFDSFQSASDLYTMLRAWSALRPFQVAVYGPSE